MDKLYQLLITEERRAEGRQRQEQLAQQFGEQIATSPARANYLYGAGRIVFASERLASIETDASQMGEAARDAKRAEWVNALAEGHACKGEFGIAAQLTTDTSRRREYQAKADAVGRVDVKGCRCPEVTREPHSSDAKGVERPTQLQSEEVWDDAGARVLDLYRCRLCGTYTAKARG